ncbi:ATP-binding protein [Cellulomonas sp. URHD0024]|uniref:ATP-binding protein n=1 Tax=Cellulomonas sp. URHD0024 TaxID=1302620 RepID=UPI00041638D0|nr:ATP-binding protein [Cellulomonas sp. URHD0024]
MTRAVVAAAARRPDTAERLAVVVIALQQDYPSGAQDDDERFAGVVECFQLSDAAAALLAVAVAPTLDPTFGQAYDLLTGRTLGGRVTVALALELAGLGTASVESSAELHASAPLRNVGLVEMTGDGGWLDRTLGVADRLRGHLVGDDDAEPSVAAVAMDVLAYRTPTSDQLARALLGGQPLTWVHGPLGSAGVAVAAAAFAAAGAECLVVDARLAPQNDVVHVLRSVVLEAGLMGAGVVVAGGDAVLSAGSPAVQVLASSPVPVVAVGSSAWPPDLLATTPLAIAAPFLSAADRAAVWGAALTEPVEVSSARSVVGLRLSPEEILQTTRYARLLAEARDQPISEELLRDAARTVGSGNAATGLTVGQISQGAMASSFADLVLPERVEADLVRLVRWAERRPEVMARGTLHNKAGKGGGLAALFSGSPGTGKTLAAHVVADELGVDLMQIDLSAIVDKYIGETEKNLEKVFRAAESRNVVLFFDEADALFGSRSAVQDAHDRYANQEVSYLLQRMEHFDGITVLATNLRGNLDKAFLRRMQFIVHFPDPDQETRRRLWAQHLAQAGEDDADDPVDLDGLAADLELAGGDIRNIVVAASYDAAVAGRPVGQQLVAAAAAREYQKLGRRAPTLS